MALYQDLTELSLGTVPKKYAAMRKSGKGLVSGTNRLKILILILD